MDRSIQNLGWKEYLGDAVYVDFDGYALVLTTEDGITQTNRIVLEPQIWLAFNRYVMEKRFTRGRK